MQEEPEQKALFYIEGPDERGCVWVHGTSSADPWAQNLGPADKVAEVLSQWLGTIDHHEQELTPEAIEEGKRQAKIDRKAARPKDNRDEGGQG